MPSRSIGPPARSRGDPTWVAPRDSASKEPTTLDPSMLRRATTLQELKDAIRRAEDPEGIRAGLAFQPRPTDVIVSPTAKAGTTWLQHIAHGLRTRGNLDFEEISDVVPFIEGAVQLGRNLDAEQVAEPRLFKCHRSWDSVPKGGRYICSFREPTAVAESFFRFFEGWYFEPGSLTVDEVTRWRWPPQDADRRGYWAHVKSWWAQRDNPAVLLLTYEDMVDDLPTAVRRIAAHLPVELDDELLDLVVRQSSRSFMLAHRDKFDERDLRRQAEQRAGLPPGDAAKVTSGSGEPRHQLSAATKQAFDRIWDEQITSELGFADYATFRQAVRTLE